MPAINTTDTNNTENPDIFPNIINTLLKNKPSQYPEDARVKLLDYLTKHTDYRTLTKLVLEKLISIHAKFLSFYCTENLHSNNNQTTPDSYSQFLEFSKVLQDKEEFFYPPLTHHQTAIKTDCETILNTDTQPQNNSIVQLSTAITHGILAGSVNAFTAIAFQSAKNKGFNKKQLRLLKAGSDVFNALTIASYASLAAYTENSQEPNEVILEKMWQSFVFSLASSGGFYAITNTINYFAKSIENNFIKGTLNALPLAGNLVLLAKGGNNLKQRAVMLGVNIASASTISAAIQSGWHFFSKRGNTAQNTDLALERGSNRIENTLPSFSETSFFISENNINAHSDHYEVIENARVDEGGYMCMTRQPQYDSNGYLHPNSPPIAFTGSTTPQSTPCLDNNNYSVPKLPAIPVTRLAVDTQSTFPIESSGYSYPKPPIPVTRLTTQTSNPPLPRRNQQFFSTGGLNTHGNNNHEDNSFQSPAKNFNNVSYTN